MSDQNYYTHLTEDENVHNCFTAYVIAAIRNQKIKYMMKKLRYQKKNVSLEEMMEMTGYDPALIVSYDDMDHLFDDNDTLENVICNDMLLVGILKLSDRERKILNLRVIQKMKHAEIADLLGLKSKTVEKAYERLIKKLRSHMGGGRFEEF